jgi:hypothetical protein
MGTRLHVELALNASGYLAGDKQSREQAGNTETKNDGME